MKKSYYVNILMLMLSMQPRAYGAAAMVEETAGIKLLLMTREGKDVDPEKHYETEIRKAYTHVKNAIEGLDAAYGRVKENEATLTEVHESITGHYTDAIGDMKKICNFLKLGEKEKEKDLFVNAYGKYLAEYEKKKNMHPVLMNKLVLPDLLTLNTCGHKFLED